MSAKTKEGLKLVVMGAVLTIYAVYSARVISIKNDVPNYLLAMDSILFFVCVVMPMLRWLRKRRSKIQPTGC